jgi:tetratricopeptide (TPR) repeat protein
VLRSRLKLLPPLLLGCLAPIWASDASVADVAWSRRAEGFDGRWADAGPVSEAIAAYEDDLRDHPEDLDVAWKLLRALHFRGEMARCDEQLRRSTYDRAVQVAEEALDVLYEGASLEGLSVEQVTARAGGRPEAARLHYWSAMAWGLWGDSHNPMAALRKGVAERIRLHAEVVTVLDPEAEDAGGFRFLGQLHANAPKVPLFTGWVDREEAIRLLDRAVELAPADSYNRVFLAKAILAHAPGRRSEALDLLRSVLEAESDPNRLVEDADARRQAREALAAASP